MGLNKSILQVCIEAKTNTFLLNTQYRMRESIAGFSGSYFYNGLLNTATGDGTLQKHAFDLNDQSGKKTKLTLWYTPGNDAYGLFTKSERMVESVNKLMQGDSAVCHFHSKLMQKEPKVGGAWEWHQDYGYWYKNEFLLPDQMMSVMIAITDANKGNGCLQVIQGSHKMGRIEHGFAGEQVGASQHYVDLALKTMGRFMLRSRQEMPYSFTAIYCIAQKPIFPTSPVGL